MWLFFAFSVLLFSLHKPYVSTRRTLGTCVGILALKIIYIRRTLEEAPYTLGTCVGSLALELMYIFGVP